MQSFAKRPPPVLIFALILLSSCGGSGGSKGASSRSGLPQEIVIGAAIAKTGLLAPYDASIAAVEHLIDETNARGGIEGHRLRLIQADTRSDSQQAVVATQQVIEGGADVLLVTCEVLAAVASAEVAAQNDMLNFTLCENAPGFGPPFTSRLSFSANPSLLSEASAGATFFFKRGVEQPFLFRDTAFVYGKADCSAFQQSWENLGGAIAGSADFKITDQLVTSQVSELKGSNADAVIMCSSPPGGAAAIKQIRAAGLDIPILGPSGFDGTFWLKGIADTQDIYVTSNGSVYDPPNRATGRLLKSFQEAGIDADISTNLLSAYAAGELIIGAIEEIDSVDGNELADSLEDKPHKTIIGKVSYSEDNHYPTRTWPIYEIADRKPKLVTKVKPQFIPEYGG
jgi:branched-chain amino acid transport system substrate-binding protein